MWLRILVFTILFNPLAVAAPICELHLSIAGQIEKHLHRDLQLNSIASDPEFVRLLIYRTRDFWLNEIQSLRPSTQRALLKSLHRFRIGNDISDAQTDALDAYIEMESYYQKDVTSIFPYSHELAHAIQILRRPYAQWAIVRRFWFAWDYLRRAPLTPEEEHESHLKEAQLHVFLIRNEDDMRRMVRLILAQTDEAKRGAISSERLDRLAQVAVMVKWRPVFDDLFGELYLPREARTPKFTRALARLDELDPFGDIQHLIIALQPNGGPEVLARILDADALEEQH